MWFGLASHFVGNKWGRGNLKVLADLEFWMDFGLMADADLMASFAWVWKAD